MPNHTAEEHDEERKEDRGDDREHRKRVKDLGKVIPAQSDADVGPAKKVVELAEHDEEHARAHLPARYAIAAV